MYPEQPGLTIGEASEKYKGILTAYEMSELSFFDNIYTIGSCRREDITNIADQSGYYKV
jgi:hypothetical protein